ncbi:hypothetical protein [Streptacidiphilus carbonis]|uniref:hypothetical protein n=1 Tax=Streptacidiphilus carbonis TaxID=105422 RepID=UPI0005A642CD|nr:hypothetical protein [Streptacidiphilus carbonis]
MAASSVMKGPDVEQARAEVHQAETELASGGKVAFEHLHRLRDRWRHADLAAQGAQARAESERVRARLEALTAVGAEVENTAAAEPGQALREALAEVARVCARVRALADGHDATVAALVAAAVDLQVEAKAPAGPRATSGHVAVEGRAIVHKAVKLVPVRDLVEQALQHAVTGDVERAAGMARPVVEVPAAKRPDHLLRGRNGVLHPISGDLNNGMQAHVRSGEVVPLSDTDVDRWMRGELGE